MPKWVLRVILILSCALSVRAAGTLPQVFACGKEGVAGGLGAGNDLVRFTVDTTRYPDAVCNDGTPAVFYYGAATRPEDADKWILFLQGGGSCTSGQTCAERWCGIDNPYGLDKMSSSLTKAQIRGAGFLSPDARNNFGTWNRVLIYYCSSDTWAGNTSKTVQADINSAGPREYQVYFKGAKIIDAVIDTLRYSSGLGRRRAVSHAAGARRFEPQATASWPDLDAAAAVLFAGSSAGGAGTRLNLDRVGAKLRATNPNVKFRGVIDAIYSPLAENSDFTKTTYCAKDPVRGCQYEAFTTASRAEIDLGFHAKLDDASCLQWHAANAPGTEWRCSDGEHLNLNHVTTPFFIHQDLQDDTVGKSWVEAKFGTASDYANRVESELRNLQVPEEARGATPGLFVTQCTQHESFTNNDRVFNTKINGFSYHDVVWNWWTGAQPEQLIRSYSGTPGAIAGCP